ncbi:CrcB-like protein-domain-containing protein [Mucor mucedo]|uniref:CrcB-like protein-domain-containing protein n=1 Tax=Mucor mucedo TaxID=29922 RepID=UPI00222035D6|nr:CrcB-like protein-domain-containing protein [Mucor mucedo]KAI7886861.1 CrcB-like protein-domain-containing protein [Mucor mucedo]
MADAPGRVVEISENKLAIAAAIIPSSIAGCLIRIAITRLQEYSGAPVFGIVYAQWVGCLIMGIAMKKKGLLVSWYHPFHPAITSGLCGSITTFSSWQLDTFKEFANYNAYPHTRGKNVLAALSEFLVTMAVALNGLVFGQHIGELYFPVIYEQRIIPRGFSTKYLDKKDYFTIVFGILSWIGVILASIFTKDQRGLAFSCVFAPVGALTRWYLSFYNGKWSHFPIGTFIANLFATIVLAVLSLVQSGVSLISIACDVVDGLATGYCGCLSTISTFMVELTSLGRKDSYRYGFISVVVSQFFMFIIMGSYIWSQGVYPTCL